MENKHDIAIELEQFAGKLLDANFRHDGTIFCADTIETRSFYDAMHLLLVLKGRGDWLDFFNRCYNACFNKNMNEIDSCLEIYNEFLTYFER